MSKIVRVACYVRVSHEDQKKFGVSIPAQIEKLKAYVNNHSEMMLVDFYIDEGISAVKVKKRLELQRLLNDVKEKKVDLILFTKLDRWGRNVKIYHQIQDVLDEHGVLWQAIDEDFETITANGKFKVNIMMSVAQQERDRGSERVKDSFAYKIKNGEAIYGSNSMPFGFSVQEIDGKKRMVHNPQEESILKEVISYYKVHHSVRKALDYLMDEYDIYLHYESLSRLLKNPLLYGTYKTNDNYVEPYITKEEFDEIQALLKRNIRVKQNKHTHIFSRLIVCPVCGAHLVGCHSRYTNTKKELLIYSRYRCENHYTRKKCSFKASKNERDIENQLLDKLATFMDEYIIDCAMAEKPTSPKTKKDTERIKKELDRLNNMYLKGRIKEEDYDIKYVELENQLKELEVEDTPKIVSDKVKALSGINLRELYNTFSKEEKQTFWIGLLKDIYVDEDYNITKVDFL